MSPAAGYTDAEKAAHRDRASGPAPARGSTDGAPPSCRFSPTAIQLLIGEPGVRRLDADIDALCRRASRLRADGLPVPEAACLPGGGTLKVTGTVGPMMRESAKVAMAWVRSHADRISDVTRLDDSTDVAAVEIR